MDSNLEHSIIKSAISGAFCGAISAFIASPFFMVKNYQMIRSGSQIRVAHQRQYTVFLELFRYKTSFVVVTYVYRLQLCSTAL